MPKNKKGAFGKRAARKRAAAASASNNPIKALGQGRNISNQLHKWGIDPLIVQAPLPCTSMQQLALNTRNKTSHWDQNSSLRGRPVKFVSGGFVEPLTETPLSDNTTASKVTDGSPPKDETNPTPQGTVSSENIPLGDIPSGIILESSQNTFGSDADSSDEVILFKGRGAQGAPQDTRQDYTPKISLESPQSVTALVAATPLPEPPNPTGRGGLGLLITNSDDEGGSDAAVDDYIENMTSDDIDMIRQLAINRRELGGTEGDIVLDVSYSGNSNDDTDDENYNQGDDDCGDNESGDDGGADETGDDEDNEALTSRKQRTRVEELKRYQQKQIALEIPSEESSSSDSDDAWQPATNIDDEHLARLLAKQEELGLDGDDLILFDTDPNQSMTAKYGRHYKQKRRSKQLPPWQSGYSFTKSYRAPGGAYPSAEAVADAFEQLEVTGWARNRDGLQLELSDSELESTLRASWQKDRVRKREKKRAREELRAQGLLKKNADPNDPRIKYPNGMDLDDMKAEFQSFLLGSENSVTLSPMDAHARKIVHEIAYRFNITSKSIGSGDQRRPTLVRKKATVRFNEELFQSVFAKYRKRFFARLDGNKSGTGGFRKTLGRKGGDPGAATVRNGEVVGGSAPEIGVQNKGRTMLEKMGWSTGMALGAMDNKGMTQIIEHVVKRSKAGLG